jgi:hypothetical protein
VADASLQDAWIKEIHTVDACFFTAGLLKDLMLERRLFQLDLFSLVVFDEGPASCLPLISTAWLTLARTGSPPRQERARLPQVSGIDQQPP